MAGDAGGEQQISLVPSFFLFPKCFHCFHTTFFHQPSCMDGQNDGAEDHVVEAAGLSIIQAGPAPKPPIRPLPSRAICWQLPTQNTVEHQICDEQNKQNYCHGP